MAASVDEFRGFATLPLAAYYLVLGVAAFGWRCPTCIFVLDPTSRSVVVRLVREQIGSLEAVGVARPNVTARLVDDFGCIFG